MRAGTNLEFGRGHSVNVEELTRGPVPVAISSMTTKIISLRWASLLKSKAQITAGPIQLVPYLSQRMQVVVVVRIDARSSTRKPRGCLLPESVSLVQPGQNHNIDSPDCLRDERRRRACPRSDPELGLGLLGTNGLGGGGGGSREGEDIGEVVPSWSGGG